MFDATKQGNINWLQGVCGSMWATRLLIIVLDLPDSDVEVWLQAAVVFLRYATRGYHLDNKNAVPDLFS